MLSQESEARVAVGLHTTNELHTLPNLYHTYTKYGDEGGGQERVSWCSGSTSDSKSDNGGSIPSEIIFDAGVLCSHKVHVEVVLPSGG